MADQIEEPMKIVKLSVDVPLWLKTAVKCEAAKPDNSIQEIVYETLAARYPADKRRYERIAAAAS